jgi:hypothetical protein
MDSKTATPTHKELKIDSPGGNLAASMAIGRMMRKERIWLLIPRGGKCVSACTMILAGRRSDVVRWKVGIHRPYFDLSADSHPPTPSWIEDHLRANAARHA